jgi:hypothetical protein
MIHPFWPSIGHLAHASPLQPWEALQAVSLALTSRPEHPSKLDRSLEMS